MRYLLLFILALSLSAQDLRWSLAAVTTGNILDTASSYGQQESNRLLAGSDGRFGAKALGLKAGSMIALPFIEYQAVRHAPWLRKTFIVLNYGTAAWFSGLAVRNWERTR